MLIGLLLMLGGLFLMYWGWTGLQGTSKISESLKPASATISGATT